MRLSCRFSVLALSLTALLWTLAPSFAGPLTDVSLRSLRSDAKYGDGIHEIEGWRYFSVNGAGNSIEILPSKQNANPAVRLTRSSTAGDTGIDRANNLVPALPGHRYTATVWARSDQRSRLRLTLSAHASGGDWLRLQHEKVFRTEPGLKPYSLEYLTPTGTQRLNFGMRVDGTGSITIEKCSLEDRGMGLKITYPRNETVDSFNPTIAFANAPHSAYHIVVSNSTGPVWDSGVTQSSGYTAHCGAALKPGTSYEVKVRVRNDDAWTEFTAPARFHTPPAPIARIVSPAEADVFRGPTGKLEWHAESPSGVTSQQVTVDAGKPIDLPATARSHDLTGLGEGVHTATLLVKSPEGTAKAESRFYVRITPAPQGTLYVYDMSYAAKYPVDTVEGREKRFDTEFAVAALQGLVNRDGPRLWVKLNDEDDTWLGRLREPGNWLANKKLVTIPDLNALFDTFGRDCRGAVVWDPDVYATSNVATTIAGADDVIPVRYDTRPDSIYSRLVTGGPKLAVKTDLVGKFTGNGTIWDTDIPSTGSKKNDAYVWARTKYLETGKSNPNLLQYVIDAYWIYKAHSGLDDASRAMSDYVIRNRAFAFDLGVWDDEKPIDDPDQRLGLDLETHRSILLAAAKRASGMVHYLGFVPWPAKYSDSAGAGGKHGPVDSEWQQVRLLSYYNAYMEPDCPPQVVNGSIHSQFPLPDRLTQNRKLSQTDLRKLGFVDAEDQVSALNFLNLYVGDYDGSTWMVRNMYGKWDDPNRGLYPASWAFNPNLTDMCASAYEYYSRTRTANDSFIAGDCASGYVNPSRLLKDRISGLPSGEEAWVRHNLKYYRLTNTKITGFLINGTAGPLGEDVDRMYARFSVDGTYSWASWYPQGHHLSGSMPAAAMETDLSLDARKDVDFVHGLGVKGATKFLTHRTILVAPTYMKELFEGLAAKDPSMVFAPVDSRTQSALVSSYLGCVPDGRATYTFDTIPARMNAGASAHAEIGVRNDGWAAWQASGPDPVQLVAEWKQDGKTVASTSVALTSDVASSDGIVLGAEVTAPKIPGAYTLEYQMYRGSKSFSSLGDYSWEKIVVVE